MRLSAPIPVTAPRTRDDDPWPPRLAAVSLGAVGVATAAAPLMIGGAPLWAAGVLLGLVALAAVALLGALGREGGRVTVSWTGGLLLTLVLLEALQLVPLPPWLHGLLSPEGARVQAVALADLGGWPAWRPLSLAPVLTGVEVARHLTWTVLFLTARALTPRYPQGIPRVLGLALAVGVGVALVQGALGLERIYGVWPTPPGGGLFAGFVNPNHLGAWLDLGAPVALGLALTSKERATRFLWGLVFLLALVVSLFTLSRGAIVALGVGVATFLVLDGGTGRVRQGVGLLIGVATGIAAWVGLDPVLDELATLVSAESLASESRWSLWDQVLPLIRGYWTTGVGRGAFGLAFPAWARLPGPLTFTHAESQPLHLAAELGVLPALLAVGAAATWWVRAARRGDTGDRLHIALLAGLGALGVHELADFATALAGVAVPAVVAMAWVDARVFQGRSLGRARRAAGLALGGAAVLLVGAAGRGPDEGLVTLRQDLAEGAPVDAAVLPVIARSPADHMPQLVAAKALLDRGDNPSALAYAGRAMRLGRSDPRAHLLAAESLARAGRLSQATVEWRLAVQWGHPPREVLRQALPHLGAGPRLAEALPDTLDHRLAAAGFLHGAGAPEAAAAVLAALAPRHPSEPRLLAAWTRALLAAREPGAAQGVARRWVQAAPSDPQAAQLLGRSLWAGGDPQAAERVASALQVAHPGDPEVAVLAAELALHGGRPQAALTILEQARPEADRQRTRILLLKGDAHAAAGETVEALSVWRLATRLAPDDPRPWVRLGDLWLRVGQIQAAVEAFDAALAREDPPSQALLVRREQAAAAAEVRAAEALQGRLGAPPSP